MRAWSFLSEKASAQLSKKEANFSERNEDGEPGSSTISLQRDLIWVVVPNDPNPDLIPFMIVNDW